MFQASDKERTEKGNLSPHFLSKFPFEFPLLVEKTHKYTYSIPLKKLIIMLSCCCLFKSQPQVFPLKKSSAPALALRTSSAPKVKGGVPYWMTSTSPIDKSAGIPLVVGRQRTEVLLPARHVALCAAGGGLGSAEG